MLVIHLYLIKRKILSSGSEKKFKKLAIRVLFYNSVADQSNKLSLLGVRRHESESKKLENYLQAIHMQMEATFNSAGAALFPSICSMLYTLKFESLSNKDSDLAARRLAQYIILNEIHLSHVSGKFC